MTSPLSTQFERQWNRSLTGPSVDIPELVSLVLRSAAEAGASDIHLTPTKTAMSMRWRIDGVLQQIGEFPPELIPRIVARTKVLAELLTYQTEIPQEGRIRQMTSNLEMRVSTFPTLFGEKIVVRLFGEGQRFEQLEQLSLGDDIESQLRDSLRATQGTLIVAGPAGSGKTTTLYACLRELSDKTGGQRSLVSLEDPIEAVIPGVSQSQVNLPGGFDFPTGLRSLMRQDPEVIMVGEIRDRVTAEIVFQAALTGHLVLTTFHSGSAAGAISRLAEMGIEPYVLRSGVLGIVCQRLVRKLCVCSESSSNDAGKLGLDLNEYRVAKGCDLCHGTGYRGRLPLAELLLPDRSELGRAILSRNDSAHLDRLARESGMVSRWERAVRAISRGETTPNEVRRVLGFSMD